MGIYTRESLNPIKCDEPTKKMQQKEQWWIMRLYASVSMFVCEQ